jgi:integrase
MLDPKRLETGVIADQLAHSRISMTQDVYVGRRAVDEAVTTALDGVITTSSGAADEPRPKDKL